MNGPGPARLLGQGAVLLLRRGWIVMLALVILAAMAAAMLFLAGRCFPSAMAACVSPETYNLIGDHPAWVQYRVADYGFEIARNIVVTLALLAFFSVPERSIGSGPAVSRPQRRVWRLLGRLIVSTIILSSVGVTFWLTSEFELVPTFGDLSSVRAALAHVALIVGGTTVLTYLCAKLTFYVPAAGQSDEPDNLVQCWRRTRGVTGILFFTHLPFVILILVINMTTWWLGLAVPGVVELAGALARWSAVEPDVATYILPSYLAGMLVAILSHWRAGASIAAFRAHYERDRGLADIFA